MSQSSEKVQEFEKELQKNISNPLVTPQRVKSYRMLVFARLLSNYYTNLECLKEDEKAKLVEEMNESALQIEESPKDTNKIARAINNFIESYLGLVFIPLLFTWVQNIAQKMKFVTETDRLKNEITVDLYKGIQNDISKK